MWYEVTYTLQDGTTEAMDFSGDTEEQARARAFDFMRKENGNPNRTAPEYTGFTMEQHPEKLMTDTNTRSEYAELDRIDLLYSLYDRLRGKGNANDTAAVQWALLTIEQNRRQKNKPGTLQPDAIKARLRAVRKMLNEEDAEKIFDMCRARDYYLYGTTAELKNMLASDMIRDIMDDMAPI